MLTTPPSLSLAERAAVYAKVAAIVQKKYFDPAFNGRDWPKLVAEHRTQALEASDAAAFESAVHNLVTSLGTSHTGFFHESLRRVPARVAMGFTFRKEVTAEGSAWMVLDVHEAGPAHRAGIRPTDILRAVNGAPVIEGEPPPMFRMGARNTIEVERDGSRVLIEADVPQPRSTKQPYSEPTPVSIAEFGDVGYMKLTILPGLIGIDVAKQIDAGITALGGRPRFLLDLRGHIGGGLAFLRMMSHLTPDKLPVGYTVTRRAAERGVEKDSLKAVTHIPSNKFFGIAGLALKFAGRDMSVRVVTEGLGPKTWHGRAAVLVNEQTVSAGEMIAAFAQERGLATVVGTTTAGRVIPGSGYKAGHGYRVIIPPARYVTWGGRVYEGRGVTPDVVVPWEHAATRAGQDNQLEEALRIVRTM